MFGARKKSKLAASASAVSTSSTPKLKSKEKHILASLGAKCLPNSSNERANVNNNKLHYQTNSLTATNVNGSVTEEFMRPSESVHTSSASSSGYNGSQNGAASSNFNSHIYASHQYQQPVSGSRPKELGDFSSTTNELDQMPNASPVVVAGVHRRHSRLHNLQHLSSVRALPPMVPMMIDDDEDSNEGNDDDDVEAAAADDDNSNGNSNNNGGFGVAQDLIDDYENGDDNNNTIHGFHGLPVHYNNIGQQQQQQQQHLTANRGQYNQTSSWQSECVDSNETDRLRRQHYWQLQHRPTQTADRYLQQPSEARYLTQTLHNQHQHQHHVIPPAVMARQQLQQTVQRPDPFSTYNPKSFAASSNGDNHNNNTVKYFPHHKQQHPAPAAVYHQPNIGQHHHQYQQQYHSFTYIHPEAVGHLQQQQQQQQQQLHPPQRQQQFEFQTTRHSSGIVSQQASAAENVNKIRGATRLLANSFNSTNELQTSNGTNSLSNDNTTNNTETSGKKFGAKSGQKNTSTKKKNKMRDSRQHLASPDVHQHHHHHLSSGAKRNQGGGGSRAPSSSRKPISATKLASQHANKDRQQLGWCGKFAKSFLFITNILFWSAGIALGAWGILLLVEDHKYNFSQLLVFDAGDRMSLFQLLSWSFITLGCATILVGFCGCSAILKNSRWIVGLYIFLILAIFALDLATGLLAIIFQERLVANVRLRLVNKLRSEYGVQASFTTAIDYIQTKYECCGLEGHFDYDQSLWRLQRLGGFEATVARTCCHLRNDYDSHAHINPQPVNESMCQSTDVRFYQSFRYRKGCLDDLERLVRHKIWTFTIVCGAVGAVILLSLFFATCFCRSIPSSSSRKSSADREQLAASNHILDKVKLESQQQRQQQHYR